MIYPAAPDTTWFLAPERVEILTTVRSVGAVSILTSSPETDVVSANPDFTSEIRQPTPSTGALDDLGLPAAWESDPLRRWRSERRLSP